MIITIDGFGGAGKSTQCSAISKVLDIPVCDYYPMARCITGVMSFDGLGVNTFLRDLMLVFGYNHKFRSTGCVYDGYWYSLLNLLAQVEDINKAFDTMRYLFDTMDNKEPTASFFLDVPIREAIIRVVHRDNWSHKVTVDSISQDTHHAAVLEQFQYLKSKLPYLHFIDGTQPIESITQEMLDKLP